MTESINDPMKIENQGMPINKQNHQHKKREKSYDIARRSVSSNSKNIGQFILQEKLGEGTFGVVRMGTHILTGEKVAVKILEKIRILEQADKTRVEREIKILKNLRHNNIVQLYSVIQTVTTIYLIMEYANGKELFDYIVLKKRLHEGEACKFFQQILSGIEYLHKLRIVHRDLKPENLLLDNKKDIKIVDFGLSNIYGKGELLKTACGSPCYAAPEMIGGKKYSGVMVDIWSSGIILFAMLCGYLPFEDTNSEALYKKITEGKFSIPNMVSDAAKDLIRKILNTDPNKRYTIQQIKAHPWFNIINPCVNTNEGLLMNVNVIPIDESLIKKMEEYDFKSQEIRTDILSNRHNHKTTTYYLLLKNKIKKGLKSVADLNSEEFLKYIQEPSNFLTRYNNDINLVIRDRAYSLKEIKKKESNYSNEIEKNMEVNKDSLDNVIKTNLNLENENLNSATNLSEKSKGKENPENPIFKNFKLEKFLFSKKKEEEVNREISNFNEYMEEILKDIRELNLTKDNLDNFEDSVSITKNYNTNTDANVVSFTDYLTLGVDKKDNIQETSPVTNITRQFKISYNKPEKREINNSRNMNNTHIYNKYKGYLTSDCLENSDKRKKITDVTPIRNKNIENSLDKFSNTEFKSTILSNERPPLSKEKMAKNIIESEKRKIKIQEMIYSNNKEVKKPPIDTKREIKPTIIMQPVKKRPHNSSRNENAKYSNSVKRNNFFNTSMSFDQNVDIKNTTFDQETIKNLEKENGLRNNQLSPKKKDAKLHKTHYKPLGNSMKTEEKVVESYYPKTDNNPLKNNTNFHIIKEEDEFNKKIVSASKLRGERLFKELEKYKVSSFNESVPIKKYVISRNIPSGQTRKQLSKSQADKSTNSSIPHSARLDNKLDNSVNKVIDITGYSSIKTETKINQVNTKSVRHKKTISEPNVEKYLLSSFNKKVKNLKLLLDKPSIKQNVLIKKQRNHSAACKNYESNNKNDLIQEFDIGKNFVDSVATASKHYFSGINSIITKKKKQKASAVNKITNAEGNLFKYFGFLDIKLYKGPLDVSCLSSKDPKKLKEDLMKIFNSIKIGHKISIVSFPYIKIIRSTLLGLSAIKMDLNSIWKYIN